MKILITGITGTLGTAVLDKLLSDTRHEIIGYSRDEFKQHGLRHRYLGAKLTLYLGDVRDKDRLVEASRGCEILFHFAALKHVDKLEENPEEAISTNILGTENVLFAQRVNSIRKVVLSSTDKAVYPVNVYGATKLIAERLVLRNPKNVVCRYGNVIASRGSLIPLMVESLRAEKKVYLTDPLMTRFWISQNEAAHFVVDCGLFHSTGLKIPKMKASNLRNLAAAVSDILKISPHQEIVMGTRAGEKTHETIQTCYEGDELNSSNVSAFTHSELVSLLNPIVEKL